MNDSVRFSNVWFEGFKLGCMVLVPESMDRNDKFRQAKGLHFSKVGFEGFML